jgi:hypothetical protein|tara:strand:+ start:3887 stop:4051 length:165 start_codon:yes stop_codon:yes gene_type:complete
MDEIDEIEKLIDDVGFELGTDNQEYLDLKHDYEYTRDVLLGLKDIAKAILLENV